MATGVALLLLLTAEVRSVAAQRRPMARISHNARRVNWRVLLGSARALQICAASGIALSVPDVTVDHLVHWRSRHEPIATAIARIPETLIAVPSAGPKRLSSMTPVDT